MIIFNLILCAIISRLLGGGFSKKTDFPRWISLTLMAIVIGLNVSTVWQGMAYMLVFYIIRLLPTQALLATCIDRKAPVRNDGGWGFLQNWTFTIWRGIDNVAYEFVRSSHGKTRLFLSKIRMALASWQSWGIIYGFMRVFLAIPAILYLGQLWLLVFLGLGAIYTICGAFTRCFGYGQPTMLSELAVGALFGAML